MTEALKTTIVWCWLVGMNLLFLSASTYIVLAIIDRFKENKK